MAAAAPDAQVILFGSHARGEAGPHSDADFLVIEPEVDDEVDLDPEVLYGRFEPASGIRIEGRTVREPAPA